MGAAIQAFGWLVIGDTVCGWCDAPPLRSRSNERTPCWAWQYRAFNGL